MKKTINLKVLLIVFLLFGMVIPFIPAMEVKAGNYDWMKEAHSIPINKKSDTFSVNKQRVNDDGIIIYMYEDYFYFHVPEASYLRIKLYIGGSKNGNFTVYDSSGDYVFSADDSHKCWSYNRGSDEMEFNGRYVNVLDAGDYYIRLTCYDADKTYAYFNLITTIPTNERITKIKKVKKKSISLKWNKTPGAQGYIVYRSTSKEGKYKAIKTVTGNTTKCTIKNVKRKKTYYYKVAAYKTVGGGISYSDTSIPKKYKLK